LDALRGAGLCDREPTVTESAFERGVVLGRQSAADAVRDQEGRTARTQCDVDWIVRTAVGTLDSAAVATAQPLCPGFEPGGTDQATYLAAATRDFTAGVDAGIAEQTRTEQARLVREWVCEIPDSGGGGDGGGGGGSGDPLVLDLDGNGLHTSPLAFGAFFDYGSTGQVHTEWLARGDGFLVIDRDRNGRIESTELFGDVTVTEDGARARDGIEALALYDAPERGGNADGRIDAQDAIFTALALWVDRDGDARTDDGELVPLSEHRIFAIEPGNARFLTVDGGAGTAGDLWFAYR